MLVFCTSVKSVLFLTVVYLLATSKEMFGIGVWRDRMWPDGWTAVTADGKRSAQFEHTLLVNVHFCRFGDFFSVAVISL